MVSLQPVQILKAGAEEEKAEMARLSSFVGAIAVGDLVKTTLGPKGMDKILQPSEPNASMHVTNDGATIMRAIGVDNPAAKVLVDISRVQDDEVGDGTTSVVVLASELLRQAEQLMTEKLHPQTIISGWRKAQEAAREALSANVMTHTPSENDPAFKKYLLNVARTTISSKILTQDRDHFAELAVSAVLRIRSTGDLHSIQVIKKLGGTMRDSFLSPGFLLDKRIGLNQPKRMEKAKILVANTPMDTDKIKVFGSRVRVDAISKVAELEQAEKSKMKEKVTSICQSGCNVFINRQLIYNYPEQLFADAGVMAIEHADFEGVERLALVLGAEIVSTFDDTPNVRLGQCDLIEEVMVAEDRMIRFTGVAAGEACSIVIRGPTQQILDEAERSLHDALCVLYTTVKTPKTVCGGGCCETLMANAIVDAAMKTPGKESRAMEAFATALMQLPTIIADNAGYDSAEIVSQLRAAHREGQNTAGLNMDLGCVDDMAKLGVIESYMVKRQILLSAAEAAEMIVRVDDIIKSQPRQRGRDQEMCG